MKTLGMEGIGQHPMVVARRLESNAHWETKDVEESGQGTKLLGGVLCPKLLSTFPSGCFDKGFMPIFGDIDGYSHNSFRRSLLAGHGRSVSLCECSAHSRCRRPSADHDSQTALKRA